MRVSLRGPKISTKSRGNIYIYIHTLNTKEAAGDLKGTEGFLYVMPDINSQYY